MRCLLWNLLPVTETKTSVDGFIHLICDNIYRSNTREKRSCLLANRLRLVYAASYS